MFSVDEEGSVQFTGEPVRPDLFDNGVRTVPVGLDDEMFIGVHPKNLPIHAWHHTIGLRVVPSEEVAENGFGELEPDLIYYFGSTRLFLLAQYLAALRVPLPSQVGGQGNRKARKAAKRSRPI